MTLCNFISEFGNAPEDCVPLVGYVWGFVNAMVTVNPIKCGTGAGAPNGATLEALWGACDVPPGALVMWWDTAAVEGSQWYCKDGSVSGCSWVEL